MSFSFANAGDQARSYRITRTTSPIIAYGPSLGQAFKDLVTESGRKKITDLFHKSISNQVSKEESRNALMDLVGRISNGFYSLLSASQMVFIFANIFSATTELFKLTAPVQKIFVAINPIGVALTGIDFLYTLERFRQSSSFYKEIDSQGDTNATFAFLTDHSRITLEFPSKMAPWVLDKLKIARTIREPTTAQKEAIINLVKDHIQKIKTVQSSSLILIGTTLAGFVTALALCPPLIPLILFSVAGVGGLLHYFWAERYLSNPDPLKNT